MGTAFQCVVPHRNDPRCEGAITNSSGQRSYHATSPAVMPSSDPAELDAADHAQLRGVVRNPDGRHHSELVARILHPSPHHTHTQTYMYTHSLLTTFRNVENANETLYSQYTYLDTTFLLESVSRPVCCDNCKSCVGCLS